MPSVSSKRWDIYLESLTLGEKLEFGEGDVGVAGGVQILEPANLNITTEEVIKRFGGSTATSSPWPEDETENAGGDDKVDRIERMMERSLKKVQAASKRSRRGGAGGSSGMSGSKGSGSAGSAGEGSSEHSGSKDA